MTIAARPKPGRGMIRKLCLMSMAGGMLALNACAFITTPPATEPGVANPQAWAERKAKLQDFDEWSMQGRVATGQLLGWTGNLSWRQRGDTFDVRLAGPVGVGGMRAKGTFELVEVRAQDETYLTTEPEVLVEDALGWQFPLEGLRYWVLGLPQPNAQASLTVDDKGQLVDLKQSGWRLAYTQYQETSGPALPRLIILDNGENKIKVVIDRWFDL